ncbi:hypothetical protein BD410DRAFT_87163 [Rickenella mellea]|uniref:Uncharacterized protein n=1 Tax=Rickenella mellea TaxID=50990 RepID=A0A4Y7PJR6_9AGAM|nr:hypothetical protein BD410DRAFT_87163 [Rickenella mellea]
MGHRMSACSKFSVLVSHVSHRFRQLSLRTPLLWTRLSYKQPKEQNEVFVSRSGQLDVEVAVAGYPGKPRSVDKLSSFLQLTGPISDRWSTLIILNDAHVLGVMTDLGLTNFPHLQYIYHQHGKDVRAEDLEWETPLLSQFEGYSSSFLRDDLSPYLSQLTSVKLAFSEDQDFNVASLAQVLYRTSSLQDYLWNSGIVTLPRNISWLVGCFLLRNRSPFISSG